jgi:hypothetical protein
VESAQHFEKEKWELLSDALRSNPAIEKLTLEYCTFDSEGTLAFIKSMRPVSDGSVVVKELSLTRFPDVTMLGSSITTFGVVMCCVVMEVLPDDVTPSHDVAYTTEQCHDSPKSEFPHAWFDKLPKEMFMNPFYGMSKDNEHAILQALQEDEDREWDAGWRKVPDRYRERRRKHKQNVKPK